MKLENLKLTEAAAMDDAQKAKDIKKLANQLKRVGKDMDEDHLVDAIADDLEMLEYSPKEIEKMVPQVLKAMGR